MMPLMTTRRRSDAGVLWLCGVLVLMLFAWSEARASESLRLLVGGTRRTYRLHVPRDLGPEPAPLVLAFHGGGSQGQGHGTPHPIR